MRKYITSGQKILYSRLPVSKLYIESVGYSEISPGIIPLYESLSCECFEEEICSR